jgi:hypothetical protein
MREQSALIPPLIPLISSNLGDVTADYGSDDDERGSSQSTVAGAAGAGRDVGRLLDHRGYGQVQPDVSLLRRPLDRPPLYYYDPWVRPRERERNRDHSRFFYPEKGVRCDRATQVCDKYRGKANGFTADPSETKDYFGKKARRRLHQELGTSK